MNTATANSVVVNGVTFVQRANGVYEASINTRCLCGIVHKVGSQWYYSRNTGKITTKGGYATELEAMQAFTS